MPPARGSRERYAVETTMVYRRPLEPNLEQAHEEYVGRMFA